MRDGDFGSQESLNDPQMLQQYLVSLQDQMSLKMPAPFPLPAGDPQATPSYHSLPFPPYDASIPFCQPPPQFHFIDLTPTDAVESSPDTSACPSPLTSPRKPKKNHNNSVHRTIDMERSRVAQQRRRDSRGKFIREEIANRLRGT